MTTRPNRWVIATAGVVMQIPQVTLAFTTAIFVLGFAAFAAVSQYNGRYGEALYVIAGLMLVSMAIPAIVSRPTSARTLPHEAPVRVS